MPRTWRSFGRWGARAALLLLLLPLLGAVAGSPSVSAQRPPPNVVLIVMDDLRNDDLDAMPNVRSLLAAEGMTFDRAYVTDPLCCPSRASILTGRYVHNHSVPTINGAHANFQRGDVRSTLATWLDAAGYRTGLVGKYFVSYPTGTNPRYVPPGWDQWFVDEKGPYFGYTLNENGRLVAYDAKPRVYRTDVEGQQARGFVASAVAAGSPFFLYLAPKAPHGPQTPAPRHARAPVAEPKAPRVASYNEADVADKPDHIRRLPRLNGRSAAALDWIHVDRQRALISADQVVGSLVGTLANTGQLNNTVIVFTSDNGYLLGDHRMEGKHVPYEPSIRVPLIVRGPGVRAGVRDDRLVTPADLAPTIADYAGVAAPNVDGVSLRPVLEGGEATRRDAILIEYVNPGPPRTIGRLVVPASWNAVRTADRLYVEYRTGERELYDMVSDPHQLANLADAPDRAAEVEALSARLAALRACAGEGCRAAENGAPEAVP